MPVAQLDRASVYETEGRRFESLQACQVRLYSETDITIVFETISTGSIPVGDAKAPKGAIFVSGV